MTNRIILVDGTFAITVETLEGLAHIEHERWSGWEAHRAKALAGSSDPKALESHWLRLSTTPYFALAEHSKEADRREVRKSLHYLGVKADGILPDQE